MNTYKVLEGTAFENISAGLITVIVTIILLMYFTFKINKKFSNKKGIKIESNAEMVYIMLYEFLSGISYSFHGEKRGKMFAPLAITLFTLIFSANAMALFGFREGAIDILFPATLAITLFFFWHIFAIYTIGFKKYMAGYFEGPLIMAILMFPVEVLGRVFVPVSLTLRMFGNILSGFIIFKLYWMAMIGFVHWISEVSVLLAAIITLISIVVGSGLAFYFSIFAPYIQATVFTSLTMSNINMLVEEE